MHAQSPRAAGPRAEGIHIREIMSAYVTTSDRRYDTKSIDTTDTILLKVGIDTTNPVLQYQYCHMIFKLIQKWLYTPKQESCVAGLHKDLYQGSKVW